MREIKSLAVLFTLICFFLTGCSPAVSALWYQTTDNTVRLGSIQTVTEKILSGQKAEWTIDVQGFKGNPFDSRQIQLDFQLISPNGERFSVPAFWYVDYQSISVNGQSLLKSTGSKGWRVRYTPTSAGKWSYQAILTLGNRVVGIRSGDFLAGQGNAQPGVIRVDERNKSRFTFADGTPYIPIGENNGWWRSDHGLESGIYQTWYDKLAAQGANYSRVWMADWGFGIIWNNTGLWNYSNRMDKAYQLDQLFDLADRDGIYLQLVLFHHGPFSKTVNPEWDKNPYNAVNGGPLQNPNDFFTNPEAIAAVKNYLRYMVARYSYSSHLFCWELFNEVNSVTNYNASDAVKWHKQMADYLHQSDPDRHLVSTSSTRSDDPINGVPELDFSNIHYYKEVNNLPAEVFKMQQNLWNQYKKPVLLSEIGLNGSSDKTQQLDPKGIYFHQALWAGVFTGGAGSGMSWFWDNYIEDNNFYTQIGPLVKMSSKIPWADRSLVRWNGNPIVDAGQNVGVYGYQTQSGFYLWSSDSSYGYQKTEPQQIENMSLQGSGLQSGHYTGEMVDPYNGSVIYALTLDVKADGTYVITLPAWSRDVALELTRLTNN